VEAAKEVLRQEGVRLIAEDTGSNYGRSLEFFLSTGLVLVRAAGRGTVKL
jgi:chemotaxis protein CheD